MIMPSGGGEPYELLKVGGPGRVRYFNWSLDGRHILYLQREEGVTALMRVPREGGDPERLWETDVGIRRFPLSPDHRKVGILALTSEAEIRSFFTDFGVSKEEFDNTFRSFTVESKLTQAKNLTQRYRIRSVPVIVVDGKYVVDGPEVKSYSDMLGVTDELVAKERIER